MAKKLACLFLMVVIFFSITVNTVMGSTPTPTKTPSPTKTPTPTTTRTVSPAPTSSIAPDLINKVWSVLESQYSLPPAYQYTHTYHIKLSGETIINSIVYENVVKTYEELPANWTTIGYIREDATKKIYYKPITGNEGLLYDFNAPVGVPFTVINPQNPSRPVQIRVTSIDNVTYNGKTRKRMYLQSKSNNSGNWSTISYIWLEGIGSLEGILTSSLDVDIAGSVTTKLLNCAENGITIYHNPNYNLNYYWIEGGHPATTQPTNLTATVISGSQINLSWTDNATIENGFIISRKTSSETSYTQIATVGANVTGYNDNGLLPSTTYNYIVAAVTDYGNSNYSNSAGASIQ